MNLSLGKEELNYVLGIQEKGLFNWLRLKKKGGYPLWTAASWSSIVASAITIGFGGSVGAEAPIVLTGSAIVKRSLLFVAFQFYNAEYQCT